MSFKSDKVMKTIQRYESGSQEVNNKILDFSTSINEAEVVKRVWSLTFNATRCNSISYKWLNCYYFNTQDFLLMS